MICPKGEPVHENLASEYTDVPQLLSTLRTEKFSGVVEIRAVDRKGILFISAGETIDAATGTDSEPAATVGEEAIEELLVQYTQPNVTLSVYSLSTREVEFVASSVKTEPVFKGLSTDFVRLDRFFRKLARERHNGYLEVFDNDSRAIGVLSFRDGKADQLLTTRESGTPSFCRPDAIPGFVEQIEREGIIFDVYRTAPLPPVSANDQAAEEPDPVAEKDKQKIPTEENIDRQYLSYEKNEALGDDGAEARTQVVIDLQGILLKVEKFVDGLAKDGGFQRAFSRARVEKSESYPFLDPFEGQFDYSDGRIHLDQEVPVETFAVGLAECLNLTLTYLQRELPKKMVLTATLKEEIEDPFRCYRDALTGSGIRSVVPAVFQ
jgi:hypothetical protein